jgi:hypothetical protein
MNGSGTAQSRHFEEDGVVDQTIPGDQIGSLII